MKKRTDNINYMIINEPPRKKLQEWLIQALSKEILHNKHSAHSGSENKSCE